MHILKENKYLEAFGILNYKIHKNDPSTTLESILKKKQQKELIKQIFQPSIEMMEACKDIMIDEQNPLYKKQNGMHDEITDTFMNDFFMDYFPFDKENVKAEQMFKAFKQDQGKRWVECILERNDREHSSIQMVLNSELEDSEKVNILKILMDGEDYILDFCETLEKIADIIEPIMNKYQDLYHYLNEESIHREHQKKLFYRMGMNEKANTNIIPCLSQCNVGMIQAFENDQCEISIVIVGVLLCAMDFFISNTFTKEELVEHLKCLSDPTKLSILSILKQASTYQSDLAKRLNLTNATISHHMNQLVQNGFVVIDLMGKKAMYTIDMNMIEEVFKQLKNI